MAISKERQEILDKINLLEQEGNFDVDVENDPPYEKIKKGEVDFKHEKLKTKIKSSICEKVTFKAIKKLIKNKDVIISSCEGINNLSSISTGAIITQNHFNPFDSIPLHLLLKKEKHKHLYKVIKEGNYSFNGFYGYIFKNFYTLPIPSDFRVLKDFLEGIDVLLRKGNFILIYPEQAMWWNYKKPRPLKDGAFRFAIKSNVPILPTFVTLKDSSKVDDQGSFVQEYTLHILKPIYPKKELSLKENITYMKEENFKALKEVYEITYQNELRYKED